VTDGCVPGRGLAGAFGLAASADGRSVYVASRTSGAVAVFDHDASSGAVIQKAGTGGCLGATAAGCAGARGLRGARGITVSADGRDVDVGALSDSAIAVLARRSDGTLRQPAGRSGCIAATSGPLGCARGRAVA